MERNEGVCSEVVDGGNLFLPTTHLRRPGRTVALVQLGHGNSHSWQQIAAYQQERIWVGQVRTLHDQGLVVCEKDEVYGYRSAVAHDVPTSGSTSNGSDTGSCSCWGTVRVGSRLTSAGYLS